MVHLHFSSPIASSGVSLITHSGCSFVASAFSHKVTSRDLFFVFQNNKVVTFNKVMTAAHKRVSRAHFVRIKLVFERDAKLIIKRCVNRKIGIIASASFEICTDSNERNGLVFHTQRDSEGIFLQIISAKSATSLP